MVMMECNKDEAVRAKEIAVKKMENMDFVGAQKILLRARQLYAGLENISQMLTVCEVHCSTKQKLGPEIDWYGILQVEQTADDISIKKQYRKFAVLLHPDKNKFPGAEAAFKLIGEAQRMLSDKVERSKYDMKLRMFWATKQQPAGPGFPNETQTFWTSCPTCDVRYEYYNDVEGRIIRCLKCNQPFIALCLDAKGCHPGANSAQQKAVPVPVVSKFGSENAFVNTFGNMGFQANCNRGATATKPFTKMQNNSKSGVRSRTKEKQDGGLDVEVGKKDEKGPRNTMRSNEGPEKRNKKRAKNDDCNTENIVDNGSSEVSKENGGISVGRGSRFWGQQTPQRFPKKQHVASHEHASNFGGSTSPLIWSTCISINETEPCSMKRSPEVEASKSKKTQGLAFNCEEDKEMKIQHSKIKNGIETAFVIDHDNRLNDNSDLNEGVEIKQDPELLDYPETEFNDFNKQRTEDHFAVDQIWAVYDNVDGMPRFYAQIRKLRRAPFKLKLIWLEPDPNKQEELDWFDEDLPVACGKFKLGDTHKTGDRLMFSHLVCWENGTRRGSYMIFPRKGQTWALFKNWDIGWKSDPDNHRNYEFEFVKVLSDYSEEQGTSVAYLLKVKGYVSLFKHTSRHEVVAANELLRFSHRIPSYRMTGSEREDVPKGSLELDPYSVVVNVKVLSDQADQEEKVEVVENRKRSHRLKDESASGSGPGDADSLSTFQDSEVPETIFCNFDVNRSQEKFESGQVWSLYSDEDTFPKYYASISKVERLPNFKVHIVWLEPCPTPRNMLRWSEEGMPVSCGVFSIVNGERAVYNNVTSFSHQVRIDPLGRNAYEIYPRKGEVWAVYKDFNSRWTSSELAKCDYDMVEILEDDGSTITGSVLKPVDNLKTVFRAQVMGESKLTLKIPWVELLRFSHQIPAFSLTDERDGKLRGCWELDPDAFLVH